MTIKGLRQQAPESGRIRLGDEKAPRRPGQPLSSFRFTSNDELALKAISSHYGGDVRPWEDGEQDYQLVSETSAVPVLIPGDPLDLYYERWGTGGIARRCDGERCLTPAAGGVMEDNPCLCIGEGLVPHESANACKVTLRLRTILPDIPGIGTWTMTTHSVIAASEIPGQVQLLQAHLGNVLIPAELGIEQRTIKRPGESDPKRKKDEFFVPVLRFRVSLNQLANGGAVGQIGGGGPTRASALGTGGEQASGSTQPAPPSNPVLDDLRIELQQRISNLTPASRSALADAWTGAEMPKVQQLNMDQAMRAEQWVADLEAQDSEGAEVTA